MHLSQRNANETYALCLAQCHAARCMPTNVITVCTRLTYAPGKTTCGDTMWKSLNWVVISSEKNWRLQLDVSISMLWSSSGECSVWFWWTLNDCTLWDDVNCIRSTCTYPSSETVSEAKIQKLCFGNLTDPTIIRELFIYLLLFF